MFISLVNKFYTFCGESMDVVPRCSSSLFTRMPLCVMSGINDKQTNLTWFFFFYNSIHSSFSELFMCHCHKSSKTNKDGTTMPHHLAQSECVLVYVNCTYRFWDTQKVPGPILNSKIAVLGYWMSLTGARRGSRECRLASNVIVMAFVISISRRVLKHRVLNGDISVNPGRNTPPINFSFCLLLTVLFVCHYHQAGGGWEVTLMTRSFPALTRNYRIKQVTKSLKVSCSSSKEEKIHLSLRRCFCCQEH